MAPPRSRDGQLSTGRRKWCCAISTLRKRARQTEILSTPSVITETPLQLAHTAQLMSRGAGFIYHCSEGQPGSVVAREFTDVANAGCLEKKMVAIHCNAVADSDWQRWQPSDAGAVVWSPFSNYWLYGTTTNIPLAQGRRNVDLSRIRLGAIGNEARVGGDQGREARKRERELQPERPGFGSDGHLNPGDVLGAMLVTTNWTADYKAALPT